MKNREMDSRIDLMSPDDVPAPSANDPLLALMRQAVEEKASDVHLRENSPPRIRIDGELVRVTGITPTRDSMLGFFRPMLAHGQLERFERSLELDFSYILAGVCRMRVNLYQERGNLCASLRIVAESIPSPQEIGLPAVCEQLTLLDKGLLLVTGPTGSGKSTTLACMINMINAARRCHIVTVEDPIEFYYEEKRAFICQRELDHDTKTFVAALRHLFRQDPDVVMIGEMRDTETMETAITLAETGHLTFSTLHTNDAAQTITRIVDAMPMHKRDQIRLQLSGSLAAVISQRLMPLAGRKGRIAAREIMICNRAIRNLIREGKINQILSAIQTGMEEGMVTMSAALADLVRQGLVDIEVARLASEDPKDFTAKVAGRGL